MPLLRVTATACILLSVALTPAKVSADNSNCGVDILYQTDQSVINSHLHYGQEEYEASSQCRYFIRAWSPDNHIALTSVAFELEYSDKCTGDSLTVYDGGNETAPVIGRFCGSSDWSVLSQSPMLTLVFYSDAYLQKAGFQLRYRFLESSELATQSACPPDQEACMNGNGCYPLAWKCDRVKDCADGSDELYCSTRQLSCSKYSRPCADNSKCVFTAWFCDGFRDCQDGSDESDCGGAAKPPVAPSSPGTSWTVIVPISGCGTPAILPDESRIVGGKPAVPHSWPWMVSLRLYGGHFCGGSILNANWIVTAAHCVYNYMSPSIWSVDAGRQCRDCTEASLQSRKVTQVVRYPNYDPNLTNQDVAMMRVDQPFVFNSQVSPVCLPSSPVSDTASCFATGWGSTQGTGDNSNLQQVMVPIVANSICSDFNHYGGAVTSYMVCAGYEQGGKDACQGDSGGPLVCKSGGLWQLQGITSWGDGCAKAQRPGVYTRVQLFASWIQQTGST